MRLLFTPLLHALLPLSAAIAIGAMLVSSGPEFGAVADGTCERFYGTSQGNDPSQAVAMLLCRDGDTLTALRHSEGEAGVTTFALEGNVVGKNKMRMTVQQATANIPSAGWVTCTDDVFTLRWDACSEALVGKYVSEQCSDVAALRLYRAD